MKDLHLQNCRLDGRYDIFGLLGRGSYAEIYVARDIAASPQSSHSSVVIKALNVFLQEELDSDLERTLVENFQNEAIALDRVRHPNIISRLGHGTARDLRGTVFHYLVLEYLSGGDLAQLSKRQHIEFSQAFGYLEQVCAGLAHAHACGVIHRDIKPQNLLLSADRRVVKIADFGVARLTQNVSPLTRVGTNVYAPPEHSPVFGGSSGVAVAQQLTPASDIYSLAKSVYALIGAESPRKFSGVQITELPSRLEESAWTLELLRILRRATENDPVNRQQTVQEFWRDLAHAKILFETAEGEQETQVSSRVHATPQPLIANGFNATAPQRPRFNTSKELKISNYAEPEKSPHVVVPMPAEALRSARVIAPLSPYAQRRENVNLRTTKKKRRFPYRILAYVFLIALFAGALFATQNYLRTGKILPPIHLPFSQTIGVASTDVNLRPEPSVENEKIGVVPRASRVKIVNSNDNWYEVEVVEFSRPKENSTDANHGWVSRKYIDLE